MRRDVITSAAITVLWLCPVQAASAQQAASTQPAMSAQQASSARQASSAPAACETAQHRAFDFWIGEWEVYNPAGALAGHSEIRSVHGGCALAEHWSGASGVTGGSLNAWDAAAGVWRQSWVDSSGMVLELEGGREGAAMVLTGRVASNDGSRSVHRITWTPNGPDEVRQHWETSTDDGRTWSTLFDGRYLRR